MASEGYMEGALCGCVRECSRPPVKDMFKTLECLLSPAAVTFSFSSSFFFLGGLLRPMLLAGTIYLQFSDMVQHYKIKKAIDPFFLSPDDPETLPPLPDIRSVRTLHTDRLRFRYHSGHV